MIVVDTSAWIEFFRATQSSADQTLSGLIEQRAPLATTEVVVMEVLAGVRSEQEQYVVRSQLLGLPVLTLRGLGDYERAADLYRRLRRQGVAPRQLTDILIAGCAVEASAALLHADKDFDNFADAIGLTIWPHISPASRAAQ